MANVTTVLRSSCVMTPGVNFTKSMAQKMPFSFTNKSVPNFNSLQLEVMPDFCALQSLLSAKKKFTGKKDQCKSTAGTKADRKMMMKLTPEVLLAVAERR